MEERREFETIKGKFILQRLPDNVTDIELRELGGNIIVYYNPSDEYTEYPFVHKGYKPQCEIIGLISKLTEEQCFELVSKSNYKLAKDCFENFCNCLGVDFKENWLLIKL